MTRIECALPSSTSCGLEEELVFFEGFGLWTDATGGMGIKRVKADRTDLFTGHAPMGLFLQH